MRTKFLAAAALIAATAGARPLPPSTYQYRAVGTAPDWTLSIDPTQLLFTDRASGATISEPTPSSSISSNGETYKGKRIWVSITHTDCTLGDSSDSYGDTVEVSIDGGRAYRGCGGVSALPRSVVGTRWQVVAINGKATPAARRSPFGDIKVEASPARSGEEHGRGGRGGGHRGGGEVRAEGSGNAEQGQGRERSEENFTLGFDAKGRFAGLLGCNRLSSRYTANGWTVTVGPLVATRKVCPDMSFETAGSAILAKPFTIQLLENERGTLTGAGGTMALRRIY